MYNLSIKRKEGKEEKEIILSVYSDTQVRALRKEGFELDLESAKELVRFYNEEVRDPRTEQEIKITANEQFDSIIKKLEAVKVLVKV